MAAMGRYHLPHPATGASFIVPASTCHRCVGAGKNPAASYEVAALKVSEDAVR